MVTRGSVKISKMLYVQILTLDSRWDLLNDSGKYFFNM